MQLIYGALLLVIICSGHLEGCHSSVGHQVRRIKAKLAEEAIAQPKSACTNDKNCKITCPSDGLFYVSTKASCEYGKIPISCKQSLFPSTIAKITCRYGYRKVRDFVTCQSNGEWDFPPWAQCEEICGVIPTTTTGDSSLNSRKAPWHAAIFSDLHKSGSFKQICSGTIVTSKFVLTAFDCFKRSHDASHYRIGVGKRYRDYLAAEPSPIQMLNIASALTNTERTESVVVIVVKEFIIFRPHVAPICIDNAVHAELIASADKQPLMAKTSGWLYPFQNASNELAVINAPVMDQASCIDVTGINLRNTVMCIGHGYGGESNLCDYDNGAAVFATKRVNGVLIHYLLGTTTTYLAPQHTCGTYKAIFINHEELLDIMPLVRDHRFFFEIETIPPHLPAAPYSPNEYCSISNLPADLTVISCKYNNFSQPHHGPIIRSSVVQVKCKTGLRKEGSGNDEIVCNRNGEWSKLGSRCEPICAVPDPMPSNLKVYYEDSETVEIFSGHVIGEDESVKYECGNAYSISGPIRNVCKNGTWISDMPSCAKYCRPLVFKDVRVQCNYQNFQTSCTESVRSTTVAIVDCSSKSAAATNEIFICGENGDWGGISIDVRMTGGSRGSPDISRVCIGK